MFSLKPFGHLCWALKDLSAQDVSPVSAPVTWLPPAVPSFWSAKHNNAPLICNQHSSQVLPFFFLPIFFYFLKQRNERKKKKKRQYHTKTGTCEDVFAQYDPTCFPETVSKVKRTDPRIDMISLSQQDVLSNNSLLLCNVCSILVTVIYYLDFCHIRALSDRIFIFIF